MPEGSAVAVALAAPLSVTVAALPLAEGVMLPEIVYVTAVELKLTAVTLALAMVTLWLAGVKVNPLLLAATV